MTQNFEAIMPVVVIAEATDAVALAHAVRAGGIGQMEITLRTPAALDAIRRIAAETDLLVGAGTVLDAKQADLALDAGAAFVISPGYCAKVHGRVDSRGVPYIPGTATATEIMRARDEGITTVKVFPAESVGGVRAVSAFASVFPDVRFMPTGGIDQATAGRYLAHPAVISVGGSWMVPAQLVADGDFAAITRLCAEAANL